MRAGWTLGGVQDTYLRYEAAGDMHVGRTVSGLPSGTVDFATLPPFFQTRDENVQNAILVCFPRIPSSLTRIAEFCLASVVYHKDYLRSNMPENHRLFQSHLFRNPDLLNSLSRNVACRPSLPEDSISATGVPPHINLLKNMMALSQGVKEIVPALNNIPTKIIDGVINVLEERAIGAGTVTFTGLQQMIQQCFNEAGVTALVNLHNTIAPAPVTTQPNPLHMWGGRLNTIPETFTLPTGTLLLAWQYWCCGNPAKEYPPLLSIRPSEISNPAVRKRYSDYKFIMMIIQSAAIDTGTWIRPATAIQANRMFTLNENALRLPAVTSKNRERRIGQLQWTSVAKELRMLRRLNRPIE